MSETVTTINNAELETIEQELNSLLQQLNVLLDQYTAAYSAYTSALATSGGDINDETTQTNSSQVSTINTSILLLLSQIQQLTNTTIYPKGISNRTRITENNDELNATISALYREHSDLAGKLSKAEQRGELVNLEGKEEDAKLNRIAFQYKYIIYSLFALAVAYTVVRAYMNPDNIGSSEMIILILGVALLIYTYAARILNFFGDLLSGLWKTSVKSVYNITSM
jgi:hypothetical protein